MKKFRATSNSTDLDMAVVYIYLTQGCPTSAHLKAAKELSRVLAGHIFKYSQKGYNVLYMSVGIGVFNKQLDNHTMY